MDPSKTTKDVLYTALGKFFVSFSTFHSITELMVLHLLNPRGDALSLKRTRTVLAGLTTQPVVDSFFCLIADLNQDTWNEIDKNFVKLVRVASNDIITTRNRFAHDTWALGHPNLPLPQDASAFRVETKKSTSTGFIQVSHLITIEEIERNVEKIELTRDCVSYLALCGLDDKVRPTSYLEIGSDNCVRKKR